MKRFKSSNIQQQDNTIHVTMYLYPMIYSYFEEIVENASPEEITSAVSFNELDRRYHTDINPSRIINGPLSSYGEELENPIKYEYDGFKEDCVWLIKEVGFTIIDRHTSTSSEKSEYVVVFGIDDTPCGSLVYDIRISDHPFDAKFPEELKDKALEYLKMENILDGTASKVGIDFSVEKVTVGSVKDDTWDRAFNRLYDLLKRLRNKVQLRLKNERK